MGCCFSSEIIEINEKLEYIIEIVEEIKYNKIDKKIKIDTEQLN